jgi:hypothetical protein
MIDDISKGYGLVNLITLEEDQLMMRQAEDLSDRLGIPEKRQIISVELEKAYLLGKMNGERGITDMLLHNNPNGIADM